MYHIVAVGSWLNVWQLGAMQHWKSKSLSIKVKHPRQFLNHAYKLRKLQIRRKRGQGAQALRTRALQSAAASCGHEKLQKHFDADWVPQQNYISDMTIVH